MAMQESGEMYLETIYILSKSHRVFAESMSANTWATPNRLSAGLSVC